MKATVGMERHNQTTEAGAGKLIQIDSQPGDIITVKDSCGPQPGPGIGECHNRVWILYGLCGIPSSRLTGGSNTGADRNESIGSKDEQRIPAAKHLQGLPHTVTEKLTFT
jgi:hypothetical protein